MVCLTYWQPGQLDAGCGGKRNAQRNFRVGLDDLSGHLRGSQRLPESVSYPGYEWIHYGVCSDIILDQDIDPNYSKLRTLPL